LEIFALISPFFFLIGMIIQKTTGPATIIKKPTFKMVLIIAGGSSPPNPPTSTIKLVIIF